MDKDGMWLSLGWKSAEAFFRPRSLAPVLHAARSVRAAKTEDCFEQTGGPEGQGHSLAVCCCDCT